ncbi:glycosyltransferase [Sphingomonas sp. SUN019]|uniref:glycosyltransferase n=1 Tax=Sphingomonas sp. SUN019 TaxID=2937788 RepID=UPI002164A9AF|nr:glycosyltransferase [Sphingomonas sp. SUN019]UVO51492.1 glycosyltransferase [Sphingomonas sp. SUN019]
MPDADEIARCTARAPGQPATGDQASRAGQRVAVFTNCYPKTSHTFIRNEIAALERLGFDVLRITIRRSSEGLVDPADQREANRTLTLLGSAMIAAVCARLIKAPGRFLRTLRLTIAERESTGVIRGLAYFIEACRLVEMMETAGVRHVHVHFGTNPATIARLASRLGAVTFSVTVHGPDEFDAPRALLLPEKIADARFVVGISHYGCSQLMRWSDPAHWPKIRMVRCGVADTFHAAPIDDDPGLRSNTLVCVARLSAQKGIPLLLEAAETLARTETFSLRIVGDGELRASLEAAIEARGLARHVHLLGWRDAAGVRGELLNARALALPSFAEGLPVVLMEAMALGRPVIATAIAGIPELVDAEVGWLIPAGSASALAGAMRAALHRPPETLRAMAAVGRARVRKDHDVNRNAAVLAALIR